MSLIIRTDITAVKLYKDYIFCGIGSSLHIFNKDHKILLQKLYCLNGQKIYGVSPTEFSNKIIIFGGKQFTVIYESKNNNEFIRLFEPVVSDDWLHSAVWLKDDSVALLTAHNVVQVWDTTTQSLSTQYVSKENSILYSGLLVPLQDGVLVLAGTVFSEVIIHACSIEVPLHNLKGHRGVIFSISCNQDRGIIVTTSDDRSVRIWSIENTNSKTNKNTIEFWRMATISCSHEVYGHSARVMRNCITKDLVVSVGEDSAICFWDLRGKLLRKRITHQNGGIWSVDIDNEHLVTGGADCGVTIHPLTITSDYGEEESLDLDVGIPKSVVFTARRNLVILNECNELIHYDRVTKMRTVNKLSDETCYKLLSVSSCRQMIAVYYLPQKALCGYLNVYVENCKNQATLLNIINMRLPIQKVLSMQWAGNRYIVLCCGEDISILAYRDNKIEVYGEFILPPCKERWLTSTAIDPAKGMLVAGDRCGNVHIYVNGTKTPLKTFSKVHGRYGPTSITIKNDECITTGRDGTIKYFSLNIEHKTLAKYMSAKDLEFQWVEKFIDRDENIICGFQERTFVVYDLKNNCNLLNVPCGGGHRSWDAIRCVEKFNDDYEEFVMLMYIKKGDVHFNKYQISKVASKNVISGSHSKEINVLNVLKTSLDDSVTFYISGSEDTTLRISSINKDLKFHEEFVFKQLSSIRALKTYRLDNNRILLLSAGGRAQICLRLIHFIKVNNEIIIKTHELIDYMIKGTEKERKGKKTWRDCSVDFDPETRIMNIDIQALNASNFIIYTGCSDACLRTFSFDIENVVFKPLTVQKHHRTCILKTKHITIHDRNMLVTCTTRGEVTIWDVSDKSLEKINLKPIITIATNKSGINSFDLEIIEDKQLLIATGGDDNAVHLKLIEFDGDSVNVLKSWCSDQFHCSQVTGLRFIEEFLLTTSIDQRITLCRWKIDSMGITCAFVLQVISDISDIQGMDLLENTSSHITVCVFGKGMEVIKIAKQHQ